MALMAGFRWKAVDKAVVDMEQRPIRFRLRKRRHAVDHLSSFLTAESRGNDFPHRQIAKSNATIAKRREKQKQRGGLVDAFQLGQNQPRASTARAGLRESLWRIQAQ